MTREDGSLRKCLPVAKKEVRKGVQRTEEVYTPMRESMSWRRGAIHVIIR
jgi:hypothetical protein